MRKHDAHVREFRRMLLKKHYPISNTVLFSFIGFLLFVGFYILYLCYGFLRWKFLWILYRWIFYLFEIAEGAECPRTDAIKILKSSFPDYSSRLNFKP